MASYESLTFYCSSQEEDSDDADTDDGYDEKEHPHLQNLSKLSVSGADDNALSMYLPNLSIETEGDADEEFTDGKELPTAGVSSDESETEVGGCYSLPAAKYYYGSDEERKKKSGEKRRKKEEEEEEGKGVMVIARPKGGRRSLCMDMGEVKACQELGFDLEHERMLQLPPRLSLSVPPWTVLAVLAPIPPSLIGASLVLVMILET
ncbi:hypothetical protein K1719_035555 [Acacia pycnantha]|nr:hypothetical protein K1719_035555 [Acacia pycnantha]